jgi:hypothetical protein
MDWDEIEFIRMDGYGFAAMSPAGLVSTDFSADSVDTRGSGSRFKITLPHLHRKSDPCSTVAWRSSSCLADVSGRTTQLYIVILIITRSMAGTCVEHHS